VRRMGRKEGERQWVVSLSFFSILLLTTSLPPSFPSSSLPLSLLLPLLYFSPSLLS
jgi:hypothetical protein